MVEHFFQGSLSHLESMLPVEDPMTVDELTSLIPLLGILSSMV